MHSHLVNSWINRTPCLTEISFHTGEVLCLDCHIPIYCQNNVLYVFVYSLVTFWCVPLSKNVAMSLVSCTLQNEITQCMPFAVLIFRISTVSLFFTV